MNIVINTAPLTFDEAVRLRLLDHMLETMPGGSMEVMVKVLKMEALVEKVQDNAATSVKLDQG